MMLSCTTSSRFAERLDRTATTQVIKTGLEDPCRLDGCPCNRNWLVAVSAQPSAQAATIPHRLMSHSEYHKIKKNMSIAKVVPSIVDSKGMVVHDKYRALVTHPWVVSVAGN
jgi:hypothetical protein